MGWECEAGHISHKQIYVQRGNSNNYINIDEETALILNHPTLLTIS